MSSDCSGSEEDKEDFDSSDSVDGFFGGFDEFLSSQQHVEEDLDLVDVESPTEEDHLRLDRRGSLPGHSSPPFPSPEPSEEEIAHRLAFETVRECMKEDGLLLGFATDGTVMNSDDAFVSCYGLEDNNPDRRGKLAQVTLVGSFDGRWAMYIGEPTYLENGVFALPVNGWVHLFDSFLGRTLKELRPSRGIGDLRGCSYLPSSRLLVAGSTGAALQFWKLHEEDDYAGSVCETCLRTDRQSYDRVCHIETRESVWPRRILIGTHTRLYNSTQGVVHPGDCGRGEVWDIEKQSCLCLLHSSTEARRNFVSGIAVNETGSFIVTGSHDETVRIHDAKTFEELHLMRMAEHPVQSLFLSPSREELIVACSADRVEIFDLRRPDRTFSAWNTGFRNWGCLDETDSVSLDCDRFAMFCLGDHPEQRRIVVWTYQGKRLSEPLCSQFDPPASSKLAYVPPLLRDDRKHQKLEEEERVAFLVDLLNSGGLVSSVCVGFQRNSLWHLISLGLIRL